MLHTPIHHQCSLANLILAATCLFGLKLFYVLRIGLFPISKPFCVEFLNIGEQYLNTSYLYCFTCGPNVKMDRLTTKLVVFVF